MSTDERIALLENRKTAIESEIKTIKSSLLFKKEKALKRALKNLMTKHNCSKAYLIKLLKAELDEKAGRQKTQVSARRPRKARKLKVFQNPHTKEIVETRGSNHRTLKLWKEQHSIDNINAWLIDTRD